MRRKRIKDEEWIQNNNEKMEQERFEVAFINEDIGKGVFAKDPVEKRELVMEYRGLLSPADNDAPDATYVYFFQHQKKEYCIDATDNESVARYVNDIDYKTKPNCKVKKVIVNGIPRLVIFAVRDIAKGVELRYDYGCRDNPWRSLKKSRKDANKVVGLVGKRNDVGSTPENHNIEDANKVVGLVRNRNDVGSTPENHNIEDANKVVGLVGNRNDVGSTPENHNIEDIDNNIVSDSIIYQTDEESLASDTSFCENSAFEDNSWGSIVFMKNGMEADNFQMKSTVLGIGSARSNSIIVRGALAHEVFLEVNMHGEVFLIRGESDVHQLDDGEVFEVGGCSFKWKFPRSSNCMFDVKPSECINNICVQADEALSEGVSNVCEQADGDLGEDDNNISVQADEVLGEGDNKICVQTDEAVGEGDVQAVEAISECDNNIYVQADEDLSEGINNICVQADEAIGEGDNNICVQADVAFGGGINNICVQADEDLGEGDNNICVQTNEDIGEGINNICVQANEDIGEGDNNICVQTNEDIGEGINNICVQANEDIGEGDNNICVQADEELDHNIIKIIVQSDEEPSDDVNKMNMQTDEASNEDIDKIKAKTESPAVSMPDCRRKGFLMLFTKYVLTKNVDEAHIIVVKASAHGQTDCSCVELFESLVQREKTILSYKWIKESLLAGNILDMENFRVKSLKQYGEICKELNFETFEFEIRGEKWMDITKGQVSRLLKHMGGLPVIQATADTVVICADDMLHTSSQCVSKEWIFECIVRGKIIRQHVLNANQNDIVYDSDESSVLSFPMLDKVLVETSGSLKGKRTLKKQCCIYCEKLDYKLSRHMEMYHHDELEVARILSLKKGSRERKSAWAALTAKGNHLHNSKVREKGVGILIPKYRPSSTQEQKRYLPCEYCRMLFVSSDLWKHHHRCVQKPEGEKSDGPVHNARLLLPVSAEVSKEFHEAVIVKIRDDAIGCKAKTDPSINAFGERRYEKTGKHEHTHAHIACRMRELARLVLAMSKKISSANTLLKCMQPVLWSSLLKTIKEEAGFNPETQTLSSPSYAEKVGHSLKKTAKMLRTKASEAGDDAMKEQMDCFIDMYNDEYFDRIGFMARETLTSANFNKIKLLPLVEDVAKMSNYLVKQVNNIKGDKTDTLHAYTNLCKLLLSQIILFNRKRAGEVERLKKEDFLKCSVNQNVDEEIKKSLTEFEKHLCHSHLRVKTRGKRGRKVAILFTQTMKANIDYLLQLQSELNINSKYVFIRPNGKMPFRGADVLREVSLQADLKHAKRITSTSLRKQLATMCQVLNLTESSQDILARFMGHDIRIHHAYYRLPQSTLEVAKVSKILHLFNTGKITQTDVNLQDIDVQTFVEEEEPSDEDDEHNSASPSTIICKKTRKAESRPRFGRRMEESGADENDDVGKDPDWMYNKRKDAPSSDDSDDESQPERKKRKVGIRIKWTQKQKEIVRGTFEQHIHLGKLPGKTECVNLIAQNLHLRNRTWKNIKDFVRNQTVVFNRTLRLKKK